jgi:hypothetical protein
MNKNYSKEKVFWQKYTDDELSDNDIDEINLNLRDFAKVILDIHKDLKNNTQKPEDRQKVEVIDG